MASQLKCPKWTFLGTNGFKREAENERYKPYDAFREILTCVFGEPGEQTELNRWNEVGYHIYIKVTKNDYIYKKTKKVEKCVDKRVYV